MALEPSQPLDAFFDGELSPSDAARIETVLTPADHEYLGDAAAVAEALRSAPLPMPTANAHARWLANWQIARDRSVRRLAGWMTAAAAIVLVVTLGGSMNGSAQAQPLAEWETAAVGQADDDEVPRTARLIAVDLSLPHSADGRADGGE